MQMVPKPKWLKNRSYPHVSDQARLHLAEEAIMTRVVDKNYVATHAFYPLIHSSIQERRYKINPEKNIKVHSYKKENGEIKKHLKIRPIHYATHIDAIIFGYYSELLLEKYEEEILKYKHLSDCVIAYRKIPSELEGKNKGTIHFAHEVFNEIKKRSENQNCVVLKFDIKNFFSRIDHTSLKTAWANLLNESQLPPDHYNVFKAATKFSYILLDDFRISNSQSAKRSGFDEKKLAYIRKTGVQAFFASPKEFRESIKEGRIKIHKYPFRNSEGCPVGIPQGLPISSVLANIYLLDFDNAVIKKVIEDLDCYYRRYSDDIVIICKPDQVDFIEDFIKTLILKSKVEISDDKTEKFLFSKSKINEPLSHLTSTKLCSKGNKINFPFSYLGFEFYGNKILIKSANLAKFYRRMITSVKRKVHRAKRIAEKKPGTPIVVYRRQLYKLFTSFPLSNSQIHRSKKWLVRNNRNEYVYKTKKVIKKYRSNYISYVNRASSIMNEPAIKKQIRNHRRIFNEAICKHLRKANRHDE
jgi:hypothetical protein